MWPLNVSVCERVSVSVGVSLPLYLLSVSVLYGGASGSSPGGGAVAGRAPGPLLRGGPGGQGAEGPRAWALLGGGGAAVQGDAHRTTEVGRNICKSQAKLTIQ